MFGMILNNENVSEATDAFKQRSRTCGKAQRKKYIPQLFLVGNHCSVLSISNALLILHLIVGSKDFCA